MLSPNCRWGGGGGGDDSDDIDVVDDDIVELRMQSYI